LRPVLRSDLDVAARALLAVPGPERRARMAQILAMAHRADRHLGETGRFHPRDGNGSLASAARKHGLHPARAVCDAAYLAALGCVLEALASADDDKSGRPA